MIKSFTNYLRFWQPVIYRCSIYGSLAYITTFLDKTDKIANFSDFNLWMWFRTNLFCFAAVLLVLRAFSDNAISTHKIDKVKSGETSLMSKSDVNKIRKDLNLTPLE